MHFTPIQIAFRQKKRLHGLCAAVAKRLSLSHEHVRQVAHGNRVSKRVSAALALEQRKRDRSASRIESAVTRGGALKAAPTRRQGTKREVEERP